jgi:hypothetical protein
MSAALARLEAEHRDELTPEEAEQFADEQARQYLGISLAEFRGLAAAGGLPKDDPIVVHLALLAGVELSSC